MIKSSTLDTFISKLRRLREVVDLSVSEDARQTALSELEGIIGALSKVRQSLTARTNEHSQATTVSAIDEVLRFLQSARSDDSFHVLLAQALSRRRIGVRGDQHRVQSVEIPADLTNEQIREFLRQDLARPALEAIARQRSISCSNRSKSELRSAIEDFIERQESYEKLRG